MATVGGTQLDSLSEYGMHSMQPAPANVITCSFRHLGHLTYISAILFTECCDDFVV